MNSSISGRFRAVVFDLDGTLVDSAPDLIAALNRLLAAEGRRKVDMAEGTVMIGDGVRVLVERGFAATGPAVSDDALDALAKRYLADYVANVCVETRVFPGAEAVLKAFAAAGIGMGICTNKPEAPARAILDGLGLSGFFAAVVGGDTVPGARKPDAKPMLATLRGLGVAPQDAVMVGDSTNDVKTARAAGMKVVVVGHGYTRVPAAELGADAVVDGFERLANALSRLP